MNEKVQELLRSCLHIASEVKNGEVVVELAWMKVLIAWRLYEQ